MTITARPYADDADLTHIKALLMTGRAVSPHRGYMHVGDLDWRLYYGQRKLDRSQLIHLWEDASRELAGFVIFDESMFESYVLPQLWGSDLEAEITRWAEARSREVIARQGGQGSIITYAFADDTRRIAALAGWGYRQADHGHYLYLLHSIREPIPSPRLPDGFTLRAMGGAEDIEQRAAVHYNAFMPSRMTPEAYREFMSSAPGYLADLDSVVVAPDGTFAAFALAWLDPRNRIGEFEPVGTHSSLRGRGLGKAVILRGLARMQAHGMQEAIVYVEADNYSAIRLYESVGFRVVNSFCNYEKPAT